MPPPTRRFTLLFCTVVCCKSFLFLLRSGTFQLLLTVSILGTVCLLSQLDSFQRLPVGVSSDLFNTFEPQFRTVRASGSS